MLFSKKNIGPTFLVVAILAAAVFFVPRWLKNRKPNFAPIHPSSMLKRIEHMEHLRLTTYFFEEVITIGTRRRVKKIVDKKREEVEKANKVLQLRTGYLVKKDSAYQFYSQPLTKIDTGLIRLKQDLDQSKRAYKEMNQFVFEFSHIKNELDSDPNYYGGEVKWAFNQFEEAKKKMEDKPWKAKEDSIRKANRSGRGGIGKGKLKRSQKDWVDDIQNKFKRIYSQTEAELKNAIMKEKGNRLSALNLKLKLVNDWENQGKVQRDSLENLEKIAKRKYNQALKLYEDAEKDLKYKQKKLVAAEIELEQTLLNGEDSIKPQLLVIVPAEVSSYIDLRELKIGDRIMGDTIQVLMPKVQLDSVIVDLDSTAEYFDLGGRKLTTSGSGVYFEVYEQLRDGIKETEVSVKKKAAEAGIYVETQQLAQQYITDFARALGYNVVIVDSFGKTIQPDSLFNQKLETKTLMQGAADIFSATKVGSDESD
ncbi:DUF4230 domain-containing protein [bacterium]|nr:DUF4230 domain-containing protein [bacterium]